MSSAKDPGGDDSTENDKDGNDSGSGGRPPAGPCPACGCASGGSGGLAIGMHLIAPATALTERAGGPGVPPRHWPGQPQSRSKYIGSLPDRASVDGPDRVLICFYAHHC